jgi:hypothetical protein
MLNYQFGTTFVVIAEIGLQIETKIHSLFKK